MRSKYILYLAKEGKGDVANSFGNSLCTTGPKPNKILSPKTYFTLKAP